MKKYYIYILTAVLPILWGACNNGDDIDTKHSIFSTEPMEHNGFDEWLLANYTYPYNVDLIMTHRLIALPKENMLVPTGISMLLKMEIHICERMRMHGRKDL